jgi:hypothetical protein
MKTETDSLYHLLNRLQRARIHHVVRHDREGAVSVDVTVPGERWELDVLEDGTVEIEVFKSDGAIFGETKLKELFERFSD